MRKYFSLLFLLAALLALCGCGTPAEAEPVSDQPPAAVSLPETKPAEPLSAPAIVTEGREPAENYQLPPSLLSERNPWYHMTFWHREGGGVGLLAETRDAAFYALPYRDDAHETALIRLGDSLAEFDWDFVTPREFLPEIFQYDIDGDREDELVVTCYWGSGTGISAYDLHIVDRNPDGTLTDYALPRELVEQLSEKIEIAAVEDRTYAVLGTNLVDLTDNLNINGEKAEIQGVVAGDIVYYDVNPNQVLGEYIRLSGAAWADGEAFPGTAAYVLDFEAVVNFQDSTFTLSQISIKEQTL